tara:strand:+ start:1833 stop:2441 length:609 start_codon:yes stop_codon:yes gene_type:complete
MKNLFIATLLLFSFCFSTQAQTDQRKEKSTTTQSSVKNPASNRAAASSSSTKPTKPISSKPVSSKPTTSKPVKGSGEKVKGKPSKMTPANTTGNDRPQEKGTKPTTSKPEASSRSGVSSSVSKPNNQVAKPKKPNATSSSSKPVGLSSEFCKGWEDGYVKGWNLNKKTPERPNVPPCAPTKTCDDYKCGYKMGMKKAEGDKR